MIDLVLAGDNAVVIGLAAAGLPKEQRARAILVGIIAATVLRIVFAGVAIELLEIVGLLLAGGILLLWVCWKMWRELRGPSQGRQRGGADGWRRARAAQDLRAGRLADRDGRHLDVARQRAGGGRRRARPSGRADLRARPVDRADGRRRELHRAAAQQAPLDRLCRAGDHPLCRRRHDLARRAGGEGARRCAA